MFFFLSFAPVTAKEHASKVAKTSRQKGREKGQVGFAIMKFMTHTNEQGCERR
jgi:hypothetical protein